MDNLTRGSASPAGSE